MKGVILFGHGSRDPAWREPMDAVAARIASLSPMTPVRCAFLELQTPDLLTAVHELAGVGVDSIKVMPMFLGAGRHAREDLPLLVDQARRQLPALAFEIARSAGEEPRVIDLLASIALEDAPGV